MCACSGTQGTRGTRGGGKRVNVTSNLRVLPRILVHFCLTVLVPRFSMHNFWCGTMSQRHHCLTYANVALLLDFLIIFRLFWFPGFALASVPKTGNLHRILDHSRKLLVGNYSKPYLLGLRQSRPESNLFERHGYLL